MSTVAEEMMYSSDRNDDIISDTAADGDSTNDGEDEEEVEDDEQNHESDSPDNSPASSTEKTEPTQIRLGGSGCTDGKPAYAVLTGIWTNNDDTTSDPKEEITVTIPITSLPVVLGRKWGSKDKPSSHQALPRDEKMLSRLHACIFYRDDKGGKLGDYGESSEETGSSDRMIYKPYDESEQDADSAFPENILRLPGWKHNASLPKNGFYAIENLARHTIRVGDKKLTKGKQAMLEDGITIQIASYCFYFLLPKDAPPVFQTFKYPIKKEQPSQQKAVERKVPVTKAKEPEETKSLSSPKRDKEDEPGNESKEPAAKKPRKSEDNIFSKLDNVSTSELLEQLAASAYNKETNREDQLVSATLGIRIAREAAKDSNIQKIVRSQHGVTQRDIIDWYNAHPSFSDFERLMLNKIEYKSYQSCITKAIQRAGFTRNETNPGKSRCTRWDLPPDVPLEPISSSRLHGKSPRSKSEDLDEKSHNEAIENTLNDELEKEEHKKIGVKEESGGDHNIDEDVPLSMLEKTAPPSNPSES